MPQPMISHDFTSVVSQPQEQMPVTCWEVRRTLKNQCCNVALLNLLCACLLLLLLQKNELTTATQTGMCH